MFNCTSEKKHIVKFGLFYKNIHESFIYVCCENCMPGFSVYVLKISYYSANILFKSMPNANCRFISTLLVGANSLAHELRVMAVAELHVTVTYYGQHSASKSVYEKVNQK